MHSSSGSRFPLSAIGLGARVEEWQSTSREVESVLTFCFPHSGQPRCYPRPALIHADPQWQSYFRYFFFFQRAREAHTHTHIHARTYSQNLFNNLHLCTFTEAHEGAIVQKHTSCNSFQYLLNLPMNFSMFVRLVNYRRHESIAVGPNYADI